MLAHNKDDSKNESTHMGCCSTGKSCQWATATLLLLLLLLLLLCTAYTVYCNTYVQSLDVSSYARTPGERSQGVPTFSLVLRFYPS